VVVGFDGARSLCRSHHANWLIPSPLGIWNCAGSFVVENSKDFNQFKLFQSALNGLTRCSSPHGVSIMSFVWKNAEGKHVCLFSMSFKSDMVKIVDQEVSKEELVRLCEENFGPHVGAREIVLAAARESKLGYEMTSVLPDTLKQHSLLGTQGGITLAGDAAHKTTTQAGLGATAAFEDALDLSNELIALAQRENISPQDISQSLRRYETRMLRRAAKVVGSSFGNTQMIHTRRGVIGDWCIRTIMKCVGSVIWVTQKFTSLIRN